MGTLVPARRGYLAGVAFFPRFPGGTQADATASSKLDRSSRPPITNTRRKKLSSATTAAHRVDPFKYSARRTSRDEATPSASASRASPDQTVNVK
jgi:hypothetical protein